ncbi:protein NRT1/ PTR FAMILY 2.8 [Malania oleifera]|uniref:protein NRT1/ PTR FAMILY 2.8 n=1 Tax=Malania oleifera TaxID=397392 RepID=UPI0025AE915E|nr:protein NRT1/ PTR FAMILY 2.8 [Malania oleifera]
MEDGSHSFSMLHERSPEPQPQLPRQAGGWKAIKYILGNESFEKLASMSLIANLTVYLNTQYNMGGMLLVNVVNIWSGCSNIAPLAGAFISDTYLGRFQTLLFGSIASFLGMGIVTLTAGIPQLRPPICTAQSLCLQPQIWQLGILFAGLGLLAVGAGGIRPCNIAFGADQLDTTTEKGKKQLESFFNWWYFSFTIMLLIALTGVVFVQNNISWVLGFAIPTACLFMSILIFLLGKQTYICKVPQGSIFVDMAKVIVAAYRKSGPTLVPAASCYEPRLYNSQFQEDQCSGSKLARTERFKWLDKAALITDPSQLDPQGKPEDGWRLCSVQQVEQLKCFLGIVPVWLSGIACFIVMDQQNTYGILQAIQMNKSIGPHFSIPPAWMNLTSMIALSTWILIYERVYIPLTKKTKKDKRNLRLSMQARIKIGIVMSILCMLVAGVVEKRRRDSALRLQSFVSPLSVALLLPQLVLSGLTEAFAAVAIMEFLSTQMPESMRTIAGAIFFLSLSVASYLSSVLASIIRGLSGTNGRSAWVGDRDLNNGRLEYYYYTIAAFGVLNFLYFNFFASRDLLSRSVEVEEKVSGRTDQDKEEGMDMTKS